MENNFSADNQENSVNSNAINTIIPEQELLLLYEKAWRDSQFKQDLLNDAQSTLQQEGFEFNSEYNYVALAETDEHRYLVIPATLSQIKTENILGNLLRKALQDNDFKQALIADPKTVIEQELSESIPEQIEFTVVEASTNRYYLIIPPQPDMQYALERAWEDSVFKQNLLSQPKETLAHIGIVFPEAQEVKIVEETDFQRYIILDEQEKTKPEESDPLDMIKEKAYQDSVFKQQLLQNPKQVIEQELGYTLPSWINVEVLEATSESIIFVIPCLSSNEVEEEQMMAVAGGWRRFRVRARGRFRFRFRRGFSYTSRRGHLTYGISFRRQ